MLRPEGMCLRWSKEHTRNICLFNGKNVFTIRILPTISGYFLVGDVAEVLEIVHDFPLKASPDGVGSPPCWSYLGSSFTSELPPLALLWFMFSSSPSETLVGAMRLLPLFFVLASSEQAMMTTNMSVSITLSHVAVLTTFTLAG
jgi:hypothetical protein